MSESVKLGNRIPFEQIEQFSAWTIPVIEEAEKLIPSAQKEAKDAAKSAQQQEPETEALSADESETLEDYEEEIKPLTAEQLQEITEAAEKEGREHGYGEGYKKGFSEGEKKGQSLGEKKAYKECKQKLEDEQARFAQISEALFEPLNMQEAALENIVVEMAVQFAQHLLNKELNEDPSSLFNLVQTAVDSLPAGEKNIRVFVCPDDLELVHEAFSSRGESWQFVADQSLSRGGCRVQSEHSLVDYSVAQRIASIIEQAGLSSELADEDIEAPADYRPSETGQKSKLDEVAETDKNVSDDATETAVNGSAAEAEDKDQNREPQPEAVSVSQDSLESHSDNEPKVDIPQKQKASTQSDAGTNSRPDSKQSLDDSENIKQQAQDASSSINGEVGEPSSTGEQSSQDVPQARSESLKKDLNNES